MNRSDTMYLKVPVILQSDIMYSCTDFSTDRDPEVYLSYSHLILGVKCLTNADTLSCSNGV